MKIGFFGSVSHTQLRSASHCGGTTDILFGNRLFLRDVLLIQEAGKYYLMRVRNLIDTNHTYFASVRYLHRENHTYSVSVRYPHRSNHNYMTSVRYLSDANHFLFVETINYKSIN